MARTLVVTLSLASAAQAGGQYFLALELPAEVRRRLEAAQARLAPLGAVGEVRWSPPEGLHLTLEFLGPRTPAQLEAMRPELEALAAERRPLRLEYRGLGTFPHPREPRPRVLFARPEGDLASLRALALSLHRLARRHGVRGGGYPFRPHVTLARLGRLGDAVDVEAERARWDGECFGEHRVAAFVLYRSAPELPEGVYQLVARFPLGARGAGED